jgi:hypothetical protein
MQALEILQESPGATAQECYSPTAKILIPFTNFLVADINEKLAQ